MALAFCLFLTAACSDGAPSPSSVSISMKQEQDGAWRLDYQLSQPVSRLDLGPSLNGFRTREWRALNSDLKLSERDGEDFIVGARRGARFSRAAFEIHPYRNGFRKQYEPVAPFAGGGALVYTGDFWPLADDGARLAAHFEFIPAKGGRVAAFGEETAQAHHWTSPYAHPAFVYIGPQTPTHIAGVSAIIDTATPQWIVAAFKSETPKVLSGLAKAFGRALAAPPDLFVMRGEEGEPGRLRYNGDALPGQVSIALSGGAWAEPTPEARRILLAATAHEAAHLWQFAARPRSEDVPDWIHEGGADAVAADVLASLTGESKDERAAELDAARRQCRTALAGGSLAAAEANGRWRASYACGRVLSVIAARAVSGGDVARFWRRFIERAEANGGYDEALFIAMIREKAGDDFAAEVERFGYTAFAAPDKELARLLEEAGLPVREPSTQ